MENAKAQLEEAKVVMRANADGLKEARGTAQQWKEAAKEGKSAALNLTLTLAVSPPDQSLPSP